MGERSWQLGAKSEAAAAGGGAEGCRRWHGTNRPKPQPHLRLSLQYTRRAHVASNRTHRHEHRLPRSRNHRWTGETREFAAHPQSAIAEPHSSSQPSLAHPPADLSPASTCTTSPRPKLHRTTTTPPPPHTLRDRGRGAIAHHHPQPRWPASHANRHSADFDSPSAGRCDAVGEADHTTQPVIRGARSVTCSTYSRGTSWCYPPVHINCAVSPRKMGGARSQRRPPRAAQHDNSAG